MLWAKQSQLMELLLKLAYCQLIMGLRTERQKLIHQTPKALPLPYFKPKQLYPLCISFPGFHCRLSSAYLLLPCWGNMQSKNVVMSLTGSFCHSFMLHADLPLLLFTFQCPTPCEGHLWTVTVLLWVTLVWVATLAQGCLCHRTSRRSPVGVEPLLPRAYLQLHVPSAVSLSVSCHVLMCLLSLLADSLCVLKQEYPVLLWPVEGLALLGFRIFFLLFHSLMEFCPICR